MGNSESRFREAVRAGDHDRAYELFFNKKVIRDNIDPNGVCNQNDESSRSILHYTARHAMRPLYEEFLINRRVSPLIADNYSYTCLHLICSVGKDEDQRYHMLLATLSNEFLQTPASLSRALTSCTSNGDTPLHLACSSGLEKCVQLLIEAGADVTLTNEQGQTPIDMATAAKHDKIAEKLETKIVFSEKAVDNPLIIELDPRPPTVTTQTTHIAMKNQELMSMKDQLLIETSELLGISLFTAEALLRKYEWSKETLLEAWMNDPAGTCDEAGVQLPTELSVDNIDQPLPHQENQLGDIECNICYLPITDLMVTPCKHNFCKDCWQQYLHEKIKTGQVHNIVCPEYACYKLVPIEVIEKLISRDMASKYLQFDIKAFVDSNPNICWCPYPGCNQAIQKPTKPTAVEDVEVVPETDVKGTMVHCDHNHYFCWECRETAHEPCSCLEWKRWLQKLEDMSIKIGTLSMNCHNEAATSQWISSNSKPCPNCKSPIEKLDGCNHMKCAKCRHDFCWMCLDPWNKHSSATGGYFECNRYKVIEKVDEMLEKRKAEAEDIKKVSHFLHYYNRYKNHCHSLQLETEFLNSADEKMSHLEYNAIKEGKVAGSVLFVKEAMKALVEARNTIASSYGYGFSIFIVARRDEFERVQGSFEEQVEALAEVVARPHLRKSKAEIVHLTNTVIKKRQMFVDFVHKEESLSQPPPIRHLPTDTYLRQRNERLEREQKEMQAREEEEQQFQQALQISKEQYEEDTQLRSDTDFAILLSMYTDGSKPASSYSSISNNDVVPTNDVNFVHPSTSQNDDPDSLSMTNNFDLESWRQTLLHREQWGSSSPSSNDNTSPEREFTFGNDTTNYGPVYGEEEDLATAIALSLSAADSNFNNNRTSLGALNELIESPS